MLNILVGSSLFLMREGIKRIIESHKDIAVSQEVLSLEQLLNWNQALGCEVAVIALPFDHFEDERLLFLLTKKNPELRILLIVDSDNSELPSYFLDNRIRGILRKSLSTESLVEAIHGVAFGKIYVDKEIFLSTSKRFELFKAVNVKSDLTRREVQILKLLAIGRKATTIGCELGISSKTVSAHKANIMEKLALTSGSKLVQYAMENELFDMFVDHSRRQAKKA